MSRPPTDRRDRIIQAALDLCRVKGAAEVRFSEIAERARVDQPLIRYHFPNLDDLYDEVFQRALVSLIEESTRKFSSEAKASRVLSDYIRAPLRWAEKNPGLFSVWSYFFYLSSFKKRFSSRNRLDSDRGRDRIRILIYAALEEAKRPVPSGWKVEELALVVQALITGMTFVIRTEGEPYDTDRAAEIAVRAAQSILGIRFARSST